MKKNKMGFLLIEWMIHFLLLSILMLIVAALLMSWHRNVVNIGRLCDNALSLYLAADLMRSDVHNAHTITSDAKGLHLSYQHMAVIWKHDGNALWRHKSVYEQGSWNKPSKSLLAKHVDKNDFVIKSLQNASQAALVIWQVNALTFLFGQRNGLAV